MMNEGNWTSVTEFLLLGLTEDQSLQLPLFILFLIFYAVTLLGNSSIMILIRISSHLHTPMYFLLSNLAFVDLCYSSVITPNMLANFLSESKAISLPGCMAQLCLFFFLGGCEAFLLVPMAYDRYVAICHPLQYNVVMTKQSCMCLAAGTYLVSFVNVLINIGCMFRLSFCGPNKITHFFCDVPPLLKLSCSDTALNEALLFFVSGSFLVCSFVLILVSYIFIVSAILRIRSFGGRIKAFSTCSSHLFSVTMFFGTVFFMYMRPSSSYSLYHDRVASVFYTVVIPMLNPIIYSLRNNEVKRVLRKIVERTGR